MVVYTISQWREIARMFSRRQTRQGTLAATSVLIVLAILVAINYIAKQQTKRWDLTAAKQYTLSDQSRNILAKLDAPLEILVFDRETEFQRFRDRLREYESGSKQIKTEYVDPDRKPTVAQQHAVQQYGTIVLNYKGRTERATTDTEQDITNGIIKVVSGKQRKVYFTQGHGEKDTASTERAGYNTIGDALKRENYLIEPLPLAQRGEVPADAAVVIVAGPAIDFFPQEIDALKKYLASGGKVLLALDPPQKLDSPPLTNLVALAREWGIEVGNDAILDVSGMGRLFGASEEVPVAVSYPPHAITQRFNVMTAYPLARSVTPASGGAGGRTAQAIVETGRNSWAESDLKSVLTGRPVKMEESGGDKPGPVAIAAAVSAPVGPVNSWRPRPARRAEAGNPGRRLRRLGLRVQCRGRRRGQRRSVHEHGGMAVAAGKSDLGPAEGSSGPPDHADGRPATAYQLARARRHSRLHFRRGHHALVAETLNAWLTIDDCLARGPDRPGRVYLFRHLEAAGQDSGSKQEKVFAAVQADQIDELKVKAESGDVTTLKKTSGAWSLVAPMATAASEAEASSVTSALSALEIERVVDENPTDVKDYGLETPRIEIDFKASEGKASGRLLVGAKTPTGASMYARRNDEKRVFLVAENQNCLAQQVHLRSSRQVGPQD